MDQKNLPIYTAIQHDQVQLVKFINSHDGDHTSAILKTFPLEGPIPPCYALSYTWLCDNSGAAKTHVLQIEKQQLPVLDALHPFFDVLSSKGALLDDTWWWIDSICINLADTEERSHQVQLMEQIYRNADSVIIWLGEGSDDTDRAIDFIELLNKTIRQQPCRPGPEEIRSIFQQDHYHPHWVALTNFFQRRWWSRIWTLQEYAIPVSVSFWCGMRNVSRSTMEGALIGADQCSSIAFKGTPAFRYGFNRRRIQRLYENGQKLGTKDRSWEPKSACLLSHWLPTVRVLMLQMSEIGCMVLKDSPSTPSFWTLITPTA
jgi:hypothetical protein